MALFWPSDRAAVRTEALRDFQEEERRGLRLASVGQLIVALLVAAYFIVPNDWQLIGFAFLICLCFALLALGKLYLFAPTRYRPWLPFPILLLEAALIVVAIAMPNPLSESPWPVQMRFRQDNFVFMFLLIGMTAFSYRPRLVLWAGAAAAICWLIVSALVDNLPSSSSWDEQIAGGDLSQLLEIYLTPSFFAWEARIKESMVLLITAALLAIAASRGRRLVQRNIEQQAQRQRLESLFGRFLPATVSHSLMADGEGLKPQRREATVMILDIRNFTAQVRGMAAEDVFPMLTEFFEAVERKITETGGVLLSYNGDAVLAAFNLPLELADYRLRAMEAARSVAVLSQDERFNGAAISVRIGLATGPLIAGLVGGTARASYTVYGDAVNLAARLEALNKDTGTTILADGATLKDGDAASGLECIGEREIRGFAQSVEVWSIAPAVLQDKIAAGESAAARLQSGSASSPAR